MDPLQRSPLPPWPDLEVDELPPWQPGKGAQPSAVIVQPQAPDTPPAWPVTATAHLIREIRQIPQASEPERRASLVHSPMRTHSPFARR